MRRVPLPASQDFIVTENRIVRGRFEYKICKIKVGKARYICFSTFCCKRNRPHIEVQPYNVIIILSTS